MKPYIDRKGRPELIVNPAIKLGLATFRPQAHIEAAETAVRPAQRRANKVQQTTVTPTRAAAPETALKSAPRRARNRTGVNSSQQAASTAAESRKQSPKRKGNASDSTCASAVDATLPATRQSDGIS
ncbi:MAG: hypothetical protein ACJA07_001524 [Rhodococcus sp. (in: high G+C Gram-positive bacteria)]